MSIDCDFDSIYKKFDKKHVLRVNYILSQEVLKDSNYYAPMMEGDLIASGEAWQTYVSWNTVYARRLYWNPSFNFRTDKNPNARGLWFEYAKKERLKEWEQIVRSELT